MLLFQQMLQYYGCDMNYNYREVSENGGESRMATEDEVEYNLLYYSCILVLNH